MVATTDTFERTLILLRSTELTLGDLPEVAAEGEQLPEGERATWSIEWDNEMAGLELLSRYAASGALALEQYARYQRLLVTLDELAPAIQKLHLSLPQMLRDR